jgi:hypothetical protein
MKTATMQHMNLQLIWWEREVGHTFSEEYYWSTYFFYRIMHDQLAQKHGLRGIARIFIRERTLITVESYCSTTYQNV